MGVVENSLNEENSIPGCIIVKEILFLGKVLIF